MKTIFIFCSLIFSATISLYAQDNIFSKIFYDSLTNNIRSRSMCSTYDKGFVIAGEYGTGSIIIKIDSSGHPIWNKTFFRNISVQPTISINGITEASDSSIVITGDCYNQILNTNSIYCTKLNNLGDTLWNKSYRHSDSTSIGVYSIRQTTDLGYILFGGISYNHPPWSSIFILKIDSIGNLQWTKSLNGSVNNYVSGASLKQTLDNGYIITGNNYNTISHYSHATLIKLTSSGALSWAKEYYVQSPNSYLYGNDIEVINDGIMCSFSDIILKTDFNGNVLWAKEYQGFFPYLLKINNGFAILRGDCGGSEIIAVDTLCNYLWSKYLLIELTSAATTNDKGILTIGNGPLCGVKDLNGVPKIGLIKIDSLGLTQDCAITQTDYVFSNVNILNTPFTFTFDSGGIQTNLQFDIGTMTLLSDIVCVDFTGNVLKNKPLNLFFVPEINNGIFTINYEILSHQTSQFRIYDITGKVVFGINLNSNENSQQISCQNLKNAIYLYQFIIGNKIENTGRFVIAK